jgi:hypothetical protein
LVFTNDSSALIAGDKSGQISIGSFKRARLSGWSARNGRVYDISSAHHSDVVAISCEGGLSIYDLEHSKVVGMESLGCRRIRHSPFTDNFIAVSTDARELLFFDPTSHEVVGSVQFPAEVSALDFKFGGVTVAAAVSGIGVRVFDIRKLDRALDLRVESPAEIRAVAFQPAPVDDPICADSIQFVEENPQPEVAEVELDVRPPTEPDSDDDLDDIRRHIAEIERDVKLNEPTLSPRDAAILKSARDIRRPKTPHHRLDAPTPRKRKRKEKDGKGG